MARLLFPPSKVPSFLVTWKVTGLLEAGFPLESTNCTIRGRGSVVPIAPPWLFPETILILGLAWVSSVTVMAELASFPAASIPVAVIVFVPDVRLIPSAMKPLFDTVAWMPFTTTVALFPFTVPETMSFIMPVTVIGDEKSVAPSDGLFMITLGGVVSTVTEMLAVPVFPKGSDATAVINLVPSPMSRISEKAPPEMAAETPFTDTFASRSSTVPDMEIVLVLKVERFAGLVTTIFGGVVSLVKVIDTWAWFPTASVAKADMVFGPSTKATFASKVSPVSVARAPLLLQKKQKWWHQRQTLLL